MEELGESIKDLELAHNILQTVIQNLIYSDSCMEDIINIAKNPVAMLMGDYTKEVINNKLNEMNGYINISINNMNALTQYVNNKEKEKKNGNE